MSHVKDADGTVYVLLQRDGRTDGRSDADGTHDRTSDRTHDPTALVEALQSEIAHLREEARRRDEWHAEEIRRRDHIIAAALERIPAIEPPEAPQEPRNGHDSATMSAEAPAHQEDGDRQKATERPAADNEPAPARSWWQQIFGG